MKRQTVFSSLMCCLLLSLYAWGQETVVLTLTYWNIPDRNFYIKDVIDQTGVSNVFSQDSTHLVRVSSPKGSQHLTFVMNDFFTEAMPRWVGQKPVYVRFKNFQITQRKSGFSKKGKIQVYIEFLAMSKGKIPVKLFAIQKTISYKGIAHAEKLSILLREIIDQFMVSHWEQKYPFISYSTSN